MLFIIFYVEAIKYYLMRDYRFENNFISTLVLLPPTLPGRMDPVS